MHTFALAGGTPGTWTQDLDVTPTATGGAATTSYNGYAYQIGGYSGSSSLTSVYYAQFNANGTLGNWTSTTALPLARKFATAVAYNGYIYAMGGSPNNSLFSNSVYYAPLNSDGTVGTWTLTNLLPAVAHKATAAVYNGYLYYMGGYSGIFQDYVSYAPINPNGSVGTWAATTALPTAMSDATSVAYNGYLYHIAGFDGSFKSTAYYAPINANGTVGTWQATAALPAGMNLATTTLYNGFVYVLGGQNAGGVLSSVYYAQLRADGTIAAWQTSANHIPQTMEAGSVAHNGYLYLVGGNDTVTSNPGAYFTTVAALTASTNLTNAINAAAVAVTTPNGTDITCSSSLTEASQTQQDADYTYPVGLVKVCFTSPASSNLVSVTFATDLAPSAVIARHYNTTTKTYSTVSGASITQTTLGGKNALKVTYTIVDNSSMDEDPSVGAITDPIGLGLLPTAPTTGYGVPTQSNTSAIILLFATIAAITTMSGALLLNRLPPKP